MRETNSKLGEVASEWRDARRVYSVYSAILKSHDIGLGPCKVLESPIDRADEESLKEMREWLASADDRTAAAHLRQVIQGSSLGTEECLRALIHRYLARPQKNDEDRNKLDFLVVQYFAATAPRTLVLGKVDVEDVAYVLEPVLGRVELELPRSLEPLKALIDRIHACSSLHDVIRQGIVEAGRKLKDEAGETYFDRSAMLGFARYNFLLRRRFVQLLHGDLEAIREAIRELEACGVATVDCSAAGFRPDEPIADLRRYCRTWRNVFVADYAAGPSFHSIAAVRTAVEQAVKSVRAQKKTAVKATQAAEVSRQVDMAKALARTQGSVAEKTPEVAQPTKSVSSEVAAIEDARARVNAAVQHAAELPGKKAAFNEKQAADAIRKQLKEMVAEKVPATATVKLGSCMVVLSSWELAAFVNGKDALGPMLQRAVIARAILMEAMERGRRGNAAPDLAPAIELAKEVATELQEKIGEARKTRNLDGAVNLAASSKRLVSITEQAEKAVSVAK